MKDELKVEAWGILTKEGGEIGGGERGQKYIYWDKEEAQRFIDEHGYMDTPGDLGWKVVPVRIAYEVEGAN